MTEKTYRGIESAVTALASVGVDYVVNKTITNLVKPEKLSEKLITGVGVLGVDVAINYGIHKLVHSIMYPSEIQMYKSLVEENIKALESYNEVQKVMAEHEIKIENSVDDIYKKIIGGTANG